MNIGINVSNPAYLWMSCLLGSICWTRVRIPNYAVTPFYSWEFCCLQRLDVQIFGAQAQIRWTVLSHGQYRGSWKRRVGLRPYRLMPSGVLGSSVLAVGRRLAGNAILVLQYSRFFHRIVISEEYSYHKTFFNKRKEFLRNMWSYTFLYSCLQLLLTN